MRQFEFKVVDYTYLESRADGENVGHKEKRAVEY